MGNFIVYKHTSPSGKCYVGITSQAPECRWGNDGCKYLEIHKNGKLKHPLEGSNGSGNKSKRCRQTLTVRNKR